MMKRSLVLLALLCATACAEPEAPLILDGPRGSCDAVVRGSSAADVECPTECPFAVQAFRVLDDATCTRAPGRYVACIRSGDGGGQAGSAMLDTEDGPIFLDDPSIDCNRDEGCTGISAITSGRWQTCASVDEPGCACMCEGGQCAYDRFVSTIDACGLASSCPPLTGEEPTVETLQCYMDVLAEGGPIKVEVDVPATHHVTGEQTTARMVLAVSNRQVVRLQQLAFDRPATSCSLKASNFFFNCNPDEPNDINIEDEDGMVVRVPCTDPRAWVSDCTTAEPVCPG